MLDTLLLSANAGQFQTNYVKPIFALKGPGLLIAAHLGQDLCFLSLGLHVLGVVYKSKQRYERPSACIRQNHPILVDIHKLFYGILQTTKKKNKPPSKTSKRHWVMQQNTLFEDIIDNIL